MKQFEGQGGTLVLFSSIAAAAPRRRNVAYAAAKAGLESFGRSMRHRTAGTPVEVQVYALGYVDTAMTRDLDLKLPVADPGRVAELVVGRLDQGSSFRTCPGRGAWRCASCGGCRRRSTTACGSTWPRPSPSSSPCTGTRRR